MMHGLSDMDIKVTFILESMCILKLTEGNKSISCMPGEEVMAVMFSCKTLVPY